MSFSKQRNRRIVSIAPITIVMVAMTLAAQPAPSTVTIRWHPTGVETHRAAVEVTGVSATALRSLQRLNWSRGEWENLFSVYAGQGDLIVDVTVPPMLGEYEIHGDRILFSPRFPWDQEVEYRAVFRLSKLPGMNAAEPLVSSSFRLPASKATPSTFVTQVYPSGDTVPENLLKFYVHFSAPMSRGHIYEHIHLRNDAGKDVELPFLEIDEELWNPTMTRLTLIIDPGRIKRGVRPLEEIGPALESGKAFTLIIERGWLDSARQPLRETYRKTFRVGPPLREPLDPAQWTVQAPSSDSSVPLALTFPQPMDHALAERVIRVADSSKQLVPGKVGLTDHERRWTFVPDAGWRPGKFQLVIDTTIEDLAGNNIGKSFEVDLFEKVDRHILHSTVKLPFEVR